MIAAVGLADHLTVMVLVIVKMLALSFLVLVGVTLIAEGFETHVPKGYIYFAMAFSMAVEALNIRLRAQRKGREPVHLRKELPLRA